MAEQSLHSARSSAREAAIHANRLVYGTARYWMLGFSVVFGLYVGLPFLAPVLMSLGLEGVGRAIYAIYSFLCHQLPQRSYFLFGPQISYPLAEIQSVWQNTDNLLVLRQYIGSPEMGWKVAWSDRMVSMYTSMLVFAWVWYAFRRRLPRLGWKWLVLLALPMAVDGTSHFISDLAGLGQGFRDTNLWLANLTNQSLSPTFYAGDGWGSFNSIMRLLTGTLFGIGIVWFAFPYFEEFFEDIQIRIQEKFQRAGVRL